VSRVLPKFVPSSNYHKEAEILKSTKPHYPSNTKPSFNPKRVVRKETPKPREEAFICMFCGRDDHSNEFCFCRKRMEKRRIDYARNSYHDEFIDFLPCASPHFIHGPNHRSYDFGSQENSFGYGPHPHHGDRPLHRHVFLLEGLTLILSQDTWTVHVFPIMVHVPLAQMVRCKRL
jgi:hypothetical protein